jgi:hypothetical protein
MARGTTIPNPSLLTEFLACDYGKLQAYLGVLAFDAIGQRYGAKYLRPAPGMRWFSRNLPKFLNETAPYSKRPELAELAQLEAALNAAFEAPDVPALAANELAPWEERGLDDTEIHLHPSAQRLSFAYNTTSLWAALQCGELPPRPARLAAPQHLIIWRQGTYPRFRMLGEDEALALDLALRSAPLSGITVALAQLGHGAQASSNVLTYLRGWVSAELVSAIRMAKASGEK